MPQNPIICAIDVKDPVQALNLCKELKDSIGYIKLGLEFFTINGPEGVRLIKSCGMPIFLDLKFHDIPNTVAEAVRSSVRLGVDMLTIHTSGGKAMMKAAAQAATDEAARLGVSKPLVLGVTVLTSMDVSDLKDTGVFTQVQDQVVSLAKLAAESGLDGVVCSPLEIESIKKECGNSLKLIVPGIRPDGGGGDDQKRVMTPLQAITAGADFIVIGRPITKAENPLNAANAILSSI